MQDNLCIIIRSIGERTTQVCADAVRKQVGIDPIVQGAIPFTTTLRQNYETAIASGRDWTLIIDADVVPRPGSIAEYYDYAIAAKHASGDNVFEIDAICYDHLMRIYRMVGVHLYRTNLLHKAIELIDAPAEHRCIRPENSVIWQMVNRMGYERHRPCGRSGVRFVGSVFGIHGQHQWYRDVFRCCYIFAKKHPKNECDTALVFWEKHIHETECAVALAGYERGRRDGNSCVIDASIDYGFDSLGVLERPPIEFTA